MNTHRISLSNAAGVTWLTGGPCLEPETTAPEAEDYGGKGKKKA